MGGREGERERGREGGREGGISKVKLINVFCPAAIFIIVSLKVVEGNNKSLRIYLM